MLTYEQAIEAILSQVQVLPPRETALLESLGLILSDDVASAVSLPPFDNSAMDGFALRAADARVDRTILPVSGTVAAGDTGDTVLLPGHAVRIMTGAPLPRGADTVVPVEDTETQAGQVTLLETPTLGQFVRSRGEDVTVGQTVASAGTGISAAALGLCAAVGKSALRVTPRPRVAIVSTGDELVEPGQALLPGQIYNSNGYALAAQVIDAGGVVVQRLHAGDSPDALRGAFAACADAHADVILTSGGVSVGEFDFVKAVLAERGRLDFWRVAIRPGKPVAFGAWGNSHFFGLPGNPVSSMVTFELFVRPALLKMRGLSELSRPMVQAQLTASASHGTGRRSYQRAVAWQEETEWRVRPAKEQGSHQMRGMAEANALLILPQEIEEIPAGEYATVMLLP